MTPGFGAKCAIHPEQIATRTCGRCGNFTCDGCNLQGAETLCPTCRNLVGAFPFSRDNYSFDGVWNFVFERWKQEWVMLSVCALILLAVGMVGAVFNTAISGIAQAIVGTRGTLGMVFVNVVSMLTSQTIAIVAQGAFVMGMYRILIDVLNGKKADAGRILSQLPKIGRYIFQMLLMQLMFTLPFILYLVSLVVIAGVVTGLSISDLDHLSNAGTRPMVGLAVVGVGLLLTIPFLFYVAVLFAFANMELVYSNTSATESIRNSLQLVKGHRLSVLGFGIISFLVTLVGILACCIGLIPAMSLGYMLLAGLYLALRNGSGLPLPVEDYATRST